MSKSIRGDSIIKIIASDCQMSFLQSYLYFLFILPVTRLLTTVKMPLPIAATEPTKTKNHKITSIKPRKLALLLPAHNEELIIATTIRSAIAAGQLIKDIYVVNDNSSDKTRTIATNLLGKAHVLNVRRSGKALAVKKAVIKFKLESRYTWLHIC